MIQVRELVDFASDPAFAVSPDRCIVAWNNRASELLGYRSSEVVGRRCFEILGAILPGGEPLCDPECRFRHCLGRCQPFAVSACLARHRDGRRVPLRISTLMAPRRSSQSDFETAIIFLDSSGGADGEKQPTQQLCVYMLGHFSLVSGGRDLGVGTWGRRSAARAVKYLAAHLGTALHRDRLIDALWGEVDAEKGRERLKVTMYFLRRRLEEGGAPSDLISNHDQSYMLNRASVWVDAGAFEQFARRGTLLLRETRWDEALRCYTDALALYRGDYLEEDPYADWCAEERERLREVFFDTVAGTVDIYRRQGRFSEAALACRTALVHEPCREHFHRLLMDCLARSGQPDRAVRQFRRCEQILAAELGVAPLPETQRLYHDICEGLIAAGANPPYRRLR